MTDRAAPVLNPATNVRQRILRGLGANAFGQLVTVVVQLAGVPILLNAWGTQLYGEWLILFAIPAYLSMTDLGFTQSAANDMTARVARGDRAGALAVFQSIGVMVYAIAGMGLLLTAAVVPWLPLAEWLNFHAMDTGTARWVLWLLAAQTFLSLMNGVNHAGYRSNGEYALHTNLNTAARLAQYICLWAAALAGGGPLYGALAFLCVQATITAASALLLTHRHPWLRFAVSSAKRSILGPLLRPAMANIAFPMAQALTIQGSVIVIGAILGPLAVATFTTLRTMARLPLQLIFSVVHAVQPELEAARGLNNDTLLRSLYFKSLRTTSIISFSTASLMAIFGAQILALWTHDRIAMNQFLYFTLLASSVGNVIWYSALSILKAKQIHLSSALFYVLLTSSALLVIAITLQLANRTSYIGLVLAAESAIMTVYVLNKTRHALSLSLKELATRLLKST